MFAIRRFFERSLCLSLFRRGHVDLMTLGFTRDMTRWLAYCGVETWERGQKDIAVTLHAPGVVFNFRFQVKGGR